MPDTDEPNLERSPVPDVFVIGAGKSGTTSLHHYLGQHPDLCMSRPKEPFFFDVHYDEGPSYYERFFEHWMGEPLIGESTPSYLHNRYVIPRLADTVEDPRFVVVLRNPIDRAYSHWWMMRMHSGRKEEPRPFRQAVEENIEAIEDEPEPDAERRQRIAERRGEADIERDYVEIGLYAKHLSRWFDAFDPEVFRIVLSSDLHDRPPETVESVWSFLGLDDEIDELSTLEMNTRKTREMKTVRNGLQALGVYRLWSRLPQRVRDAGKDLLSKVSEGTRPPMDDDVRSRLADYYRPWNRKLASLIDRDLSAWEV